MCLMYINVLLLGTPWNSKMCELWGKWTSLGLAAAALGKGMGAAGLLKLEAWLEAWLEGMLVHPACWLSRSAPIISSALAGPQKHAACRNASRRAIFGVLLSLLAGHAALQAKEEASADLAAAKAAQQAAEQAQHDAAQRAQQLEQELQHVQQSVTEAQAGLEAERAQREALTGALQEECAARAQAQEGLAAAQAQVCCAGWVVKLVC
jgi:hypothetical protein